MPSTVHEIMNRELFGLRPDESAADALGYLRALGIHAAPVIGEDARPVGMLSKTDLLGDLGAASVDDRMNKPAITVSQSDPIEHAARLAADTGLHHLVAVDDAGAAVGFVSVLDLLRGVMGLGRHHPASFPHYDEFTGLEWTNDADLSESGLQSAPDGPGLFVLIKTGAGQPDRIVWADATQNVRKALTDLTGTAQGHLAKDVQRGLLRFRAATVADPAARERAFEALGERILKSNAPPG
jgi:CBS domain-containing protein